VWLGLTNGKARNERLVRAIAEALTLPPRQKIAFESFRIKYIILFDF